MLLQFQKKLHKLTTPSQKLLVALSGGVDSVVLLDLLCKTHCKTKLRAIYIHHGLSKNADDWADFCQQFCEQRHIECIIKRVIFDPTKNIENSARKARYQAFRETILSDEMLVTAHHLDDQAETFFLALKRGNGLKGLSAMQDISHSHGFTLLRPLLAFSKQELTAYAKENRLKWIEDESNFNTDFDRNFLRQEVLPLLNQRWKQFPRMVSRSAKHCENQQLLLEELLNDELYKIANFAKKSLNVTAFPQFSILKQQQLLRLWLEKCNVTMPSVVQLEQLMNFIDIPADKNPQLKLGKHIVRRYQSQLFITTELVDIPPFSEYLAPNKGIRLPHNLAEITHFGDHLFCKFSQRSDRYLLPQELANQTLEIRLGCVGKVKLHNKSQREEMKKIWQQNQIPTWLRSQTPVVFFEDQYVMVLKQD
ncbi:tRNA lysidine(34) synthetase TilS [Phocoenobacter skyensis]|uniref:tRNA(Ile)-lysidine synthase n=1 Tax=Phocoenobacter skyensis TaxID=97481 RepID=A0ABT9JJX8_9PAST|nr:tRNA lysidine(34) synthetase TilS [Pasteurella skyensis]MDP8078535.1 tRNA lysidine(34) synthetase TilS [Pasteurella skyensis]MDP8084373.1 tRNA lysidine(34) synthetase TilS [Pasteurella skyensis]